MGDFRDVINPEHKLETSEMFELVRNNVVGKDAVFTGPFGERKLIYCDYTASGKPLDFIENYITDYVTPFYANTHTTTSVSALQTSHFRENSRDIIRRCVNATEEDAVIFTGNGVTAAVHKLIHALELTGNKASRTVVIVGPYEHHSNILPWKETGAKVERIRDGPGGHIDSKAFESRLAHYFREGANIIVAMSAASNITGIMTDVNSIAELTHKYGGLSIWDYATAGPYLKMDMNPPGLAYKDAILCSPHKFVGGVGTPGILVAKKKIFLNPVPGGCGGGSVVYVTQQVHEYVSSIEEREEGGTPAIVESIRAGLVFQLKDAIGETEIEEKEHELCSRVYKRWRMNENLCILGSHQATRLPIFSILIKHKETGKYLHHNYVAMLMNDLYGIQVRGGCACAGPYAQDLLSMTEERAQSFVYFLSEQDGNTERLAIMKPGFARINFPFFLDDETVEFLLEAVDMLVTHGWKLLPLYRFDPKTGEWFHRELGTIKVRDLQDICYSKSGLQMKGSLRLLKKKGTVSLQEVLKQAKECYEKAKELAEHINMDDDPDMELDDEQRSMVWFLQPKEAHMFLNYPALKYLPMKSQNMPFKQRRNSLFRTKNKIKKALLAAEMDNQVPHLKILQRDSLFADEFSSEPNEDHTKDKPQQKPPTTDNFYIEQDLDIQSKISEQSEDIKSNRIEGYSNDINKNILEESLKRNPEQDNTLSLKKGQNSGYGTTKSSTSRRKYNRKHRRHHKNDVGCCVVL